MGILRTGKWSLLDPRRPEAGLKLSYTGGSPCDGDTRRSTHFHFECNRDAGHGEPIAVCQSSGASSHTLLLKYLTLGTKISTHLGFRRLRVHRHLGNRVCLPYQTDVAYLLFMVCVCV